MAGVNVAGTSVAVLAASDVDVSSGTAVSAGTDVDVAETASGWTVSAIGAQLAKNIIVNKIEKTVLIFISSLNTKYVCKLFPLRFLITIDLIIFLKFGKDKMFSITGE